MDAFLSINPASDTPLATQIVRKIADAIDTGRWRTGTRLPSLRRLADHLGVSIQTVSTAYNRLVASGMIEARKASGYFVARSPVTAPQRANTRPEISINANWLLQHAFETKPGIIQAGSGWLPDSYQFEDGVRHALSAISRRTAPHVFGYGPPQGLQPLCTQISIMAEASGLRCPADQIILTHGAAQAIELALRSLTKPGDTILLEDPGYCNLLPLVEMLGLRPIGIPRLKDGPCLESLARALREQAPKLMFINTRLHNPTGANCTPATIHGILSLAERHNILIVEDDIFGHLAPDGCLSCAHLDQLSRVITIGSFSKTIAPGLRVGYMVAPSAVLPTLLLRKMTTTLTSSALSEAVVHHILSEGQYRLHVARLKDRLSWARREVLVKIEQAGLEPFLTPEGGMFVWARLPDRVDPQILAEDGGRRGIALAPGSFFNPSGKRSQWLRLNAPHANDPRVFKFLAEKISEVAA